MKIVAESDGASYGFEEVQFALDSMIESLETFLYGASARPEEEVIEIEHSMLAPDSFTQVNLSSRACCTVEPEKGTS
jgi:hypothetical protein